MTDLYKALDEAFPDPSSTLDVEVEAAIERLKEAAEKAVKIAPGQWERDFEKGEGEYGIGPDTHSGYRVPYVYDGTGKRLFDAHASEVAEIHEEWDGDENGSYCTATDEASCTVLDFTVAANPAFILSLISSYEERGQEIERLEGLQDEYDLFEAENELAFKDLDHEIADLKASLSQAQDRIKSLEAGLQVSAGAFERLSCGAEALNMEVTAKVARAYASGCRALLSTPKGSDEA